MNDPIDGDNVLYPYPRQPGHAGGAARRGALRQGLSRMSDVGGGLLHAAGAVLRFLFFVAWQMTRAVICAVLVLVEPVLRLMLMGLAFLSFLVTLLFGFMMHAPNFPKWGMLAFAIGLVLMYWLFLGFMSLFMRLPPYRDRYR